MSCETSAEEIRLSSARLLDVGDTQDSLLGCPSLFWTVGTPEGSNTCDHAPSTIIHNYNTTVHPKCTSHEPWCIPFCDAAFFVRARGERST